MVGDIREKITGEDREIAPGRSKEFYLFHVADLEQAFSDLLVGELAVAEDSTAGLDGFDNLTGLVTGDSEAGCVGINLHRAAKGLLSTGGHAGM